MPQIEQLPLVLISQLFWLALIFATIFFVVGRGMLPKVRSTITRRDAAIAEALEKARSAQQAAEEAEAEWRVQMEAARSEATRIAAEARSEAAREIESRLKEVLDRIDERVEEARVRIWHSVQAARSEIEGEMASATRDMVAQLSGLAINRKEAAKALAAEFDKLNGNGRNKRRAQTAVMPSEQVRA